MSPKKENLPINMEPESPDGGTITYASEVIAIIAGIAANEVEGIAGMCTAGGIGDIIGKNRNITRGVKVEVGTEEVSVDLYSIIEYGQPIQKVASEAQENVRKSIETMTGLKVVRVDVHVQGVSFEKEKREAQSNLASANLQNLPEAEPVRQNVKTPRSDGPLHEKEAGAGEGEKAAEPQVAQSEAQPVPVAEHPEPDPAGGEGRREDVSASEREAQATPAEAEPDQAEGGAGSAAGPAPGDGPAPGGKLARRNRKASKA